MAGPPEAKPEANFEGPAVDFKWDGKPVRLHFATEDDHIAKVVRNTKTFYEVEMLRDIRARLFFAKCAVDVGAHVGNHTVFFAHVLGLRTIAFEPNPASFRHLKANISANALGENASCTIWRSDISAAAPSFACTERSATAAPSACSLPARGTSR